MIVDNEYHLYWGFDDRDGGWADFGVFFWEEFAEDSEI